MVFRTNISKAIVHFVPCNKSKSQNNCYRKPAWMNESVLAKIKQKSSAFEQYKLTRDGINYLAYTKARNAAKT